MKQTTMLAVGFVVGIIVIASIYGVYSFYVAAPSNDNPTPTPASDVFPTPTDPSRLHRHHQLQWRQPVNLQSLKNPKLATQLLHPVQPVSP